MSYKFLAGVLVLASLSGPAFAADAPDPATDATTPMDKELGNQPTPKDNTLSNQEIEHLQHPNAPVSGSMTPDPDQGVPSVSGATPSYKEKGGSAAKSETPEQ